jgi:hypothetical protein
MQLAWTPVPHDKINNVVAPDGGAHVCAPRQVGQNKGHYILRHTAVGGLTESTDEGSCRRHSHEAVDGGVHPSEQY